MSPKKPMSNAEYAVRNAGWRRGMKGVYYVVAWGIASEVLGHPASVDEVGKHQMWSRATAYRHRDAFLASFPGEETPERMWGNVGARGVDQPAAVGRALVARWVPA